MRDLVNVEAIPFDVLNAGITWDWETFPEFLDAAAARGRRSISAFIAPLTPFRHWVMGEASMERAATPEETAQDRRPARRGGRCRRVRLLLDHAQPAYRLSRAAARLPQRQPRRAEGLLPTCCKKRGKGAIEIALTRQVGVLEEDEYELLDFLLDRERPAGDLPRAVPARRHPRGLRDTLRRPRRMIAGRAAADLAAAADPRSQHAQPVLVRRLHVWKRVFADKSKEAQRAVYADPAFRNAFRDELKNPTGFSDWRRIDRARGARTRR